MPTLVGIPTLNGPDRLWRCLRSIRENTESARVLVSDDCSDPANLAKNKEAVHVFGAPLLMADERLGVSKQWNRLITHVPDTDICVLVNDDVEVEPDWLDVLEFTLRRNPRIGMVSLKCETGVTRATSRTPRPLLDYRTARIDDGSGSLLSSGGACFAFRRSDWEQVGGFDERYFCFYEELDFGLSLARHLERFSVIADYPVVCHMGGATTSANCDANAVLLDSRRKFAEKWGTTLDALREEMIQRPRPEWLEWNNTWKTMRHP